MPVAALAGCWARAWDADWLRGAQRRPSPNFGPRPAGAMPVLAVLHSISLPPGRCGGPQIPRFFTNRLRASGHPFFAQIAGLQVSAHFLVRRDGRVLQFVEVTERAWHAGLSCWRGVANRNDDSVGIEIEGLEGSTFTAAQYRAVARLLRCLVRRWPLAEVVGHEHIAPLRKRDPGPGWHWRRLAQRLQGLPLAVTPATATVAELRALADPCETPGPAGA
ncbi:MAG TPA: 1,6-anhydro-N-acetylmuramyl-L-alanine amidase AmpD [Burkholderiaceae bacterium]|nr:1,6-anhydro-N-acetylmuramyl-L-alanine amidase AmpD [Burkholderiaceae bacterium]